MAKHDSIPVGPALAEPHLGYRQLLTLVISLAVLVVLLPVGAMATSQLVTIVDQNGTTTADVDAGKLQVAAGFSSNQKLVYQGIGTTDLTVLGPFDPGETIGVTMLTFSESNQNGTLVALRYATGNTAEACRNNAIDVKVMIVRVGGDSTVAIPLAQPLRLTGPNRRARWCLVGHTNGLIVDMNVAYFTEG